MGFFKNLFGGSKDKPEQEDYLPEESEFGDSEQLSEEDAQLIYDSSGRDEDYDFRPSRYENEDEDEWDGNPDDIKYDVEQAKKEYRDGLTPVVTERAGVPPEYEENSLYSFLCSECEGYGVELWEHPSGIREQECSYCYGSGLEEADGEVASERLEWGEVPVYVNEENY